ncbi:Hypothetical protein DHA2_153456 [Giardia duodenalis]|uniref:Uncharacterized protein n=1 Tax=Giardia intestinalis TaxID=5741 RepID=V6T9U9_GIAIN|nr:Hypothetical protein DHA2_153456 [Giardia intestinalis]
MEQLGNILYEYATSPSEPIASVGEYLANPISSSVLEKIFLNLDTFAAEYSNKGEELLAREIVLSILQRDDSFLSTPAGIDRLIDLSGNLLCEMCSRLHQWVTEESALTEEALTLASNLLELKAAVDTELINITAERDSLAAYTTPYVLVQISSRLEFTIDVLNKLLALQEKRERVMAHRRRDECTAAIELSNIYAEDLVSFSLLIKIPLDELHRHVPPLDQMSHNQIQSSYFAELIGASDKGIDVLINILSRGIAFIEVSSVTSTFHSYIMTKLQNSSSFEDILWVYTFVHRVVHEKALEVIRVSFFTAGSKVFEEVSKAMVRVRDKQTYANLSCADIFKEHINNAILLFLIQHYTNFLLTHCFSLSEDEVGASTTRLSMAISTCIDSLTLSAYMKMRSLFLADLFVNAFDTYYELLESMEMPWIVLSTLRGNGFDSTNILLELFQQSGGPNDIRTLVVPILLKRIKNDSCYEQKVLAFRSIFDPQWHSSFHKRGEYYIHRSSATRSLVDCAVVLECAVDILTHDKLQKAIMLVDAVQQLAFRILLFHIFRESKIPYTAMQCSIRTKFQTYATSIHQRLTDSLFVDNSRLGPGSEHILLGLLREYSLTISNIFQHSKKYTLLTDATGITLRESLAETVEELNAYYLLQNIIHSISEKLYLETQMPAACNHDKQQHSEDPKGSSATEELQPPQPVEDGQIACDESDIFASESCNPSMLTSTGQLLADSAMLSIRSLQSVYAAIESVIQSIIASELNRNFNLVEIMYTTIKNAAGEYRKEAKVDRASKTVYSSKLISTLKNNFYNLRFGILATQSSISVSSTDSVLSIVTPPTGSVGRPTCSLFNYQFYNAFVIHACQCFIASASSIPVYTAYGRTCLMYDYCSLHSFLNSVLPDFCLQRVEIQQHFELVRSYIDLYFGSTDDIRVAISTNKFGVGPLLALIRTGLACRLTSAQIDSLVLELPSSLQEKQST